MRHSHLRFFLSYRGNGMRLIHCGDLHLDSKMESNLTREQAKERKEEILLTYVQMIDYAKKNDVQAVLIAGDLFDTSKVSKRTQNIVLNSVKSNPQIDFLYLRGNHDTSSFLDALKLGEGGELPQNLKLFGESWTHYEYGDVIISGVELSASNMKHVYDALILSPEHFHIVMLHGQEAKYKGKDTTPKITLSELKNRNIDYLALGHIHTYKEGKLDCRGEYCYCGCLEGRGFDECGQKGFVLLDIEGKKCKRTFIPMGRRTLHEIFVDVTGIMTTSQAVNNIEHEVEGICADDLIKVVLTGEVEVETELDISYLSKILQEKFYFGKVYNETKLAIHIEQLAHDVSLKGEFLRMVLAEKKLSNKAKEQICILGVRALAGEELGL